MNPAHASQRAPPQVRFRLAAARACRCVRRFAAYGTVAALILIAGVWASWGTAQHVMLSKGRLSRAR